MVLECHRRAAQAHRIGATATHPITKADFLEFEGRGGTWYANINRKHVGLEIQPMLFTLHRRGDRMKRSNPDVMELIRPVVMCFAGVLVTTLLLSTINSFVPTEHLMLGYLLPTIFVAIYFGSTLAVLTAFASGLAAAYFLLPPEFSFYIDDPVHVAELGFTTVLALIASKVIGVLKY